MTLVQEHGGTPTMTPALNLRVGEVVEVRSEEEILQTLDSRGTLDSLPFMPEMRRFCGQRFRVYKRAGKACDTIEWRALRRMQNAVHLEGLRCDGAAHGGCQAGCLIYWKEAWLKRVADATTHFETTDADPVESTRAIGPERSRPAGQFAAGTTQTLDQATRRDTGSGEEIFSCQATELLRATTGDIPWWQPGQYVGDVRSGNAGPRSVIRGLLVGLFNKFQQANLRLLPRWTLIHDGMAYPFLNGRMRGGTAPVGVLDLKPGELVEVRSREEIFQTLNDRDRTRGLRFDREMLRYCGRRGRVLKRVNKIIDEKTGRMLSIKTDCIIIDGFICTGDYHRSCPRSIYTYWREAWLKRVPDARGDERFPDRPALCGSAVQAHRSPDSSRLLTSGRGEPTGG
jgi:hypothetical protein